jgi:hypothetical protein
MITKQNLLDIGFSEVSDIVYKMMIHPDHTLFLNIWEQKHVKGLYNAIPRAEIQYYSELVLHWSTPETSPSELFKGVILTDISELKWLLGRCDMLMDTFEPTEPMIKR